MNIYIYVCVCDMCVFQLPQSSIVFPPTCCRTTCSVSLSTDIRLLTHSLQETNTKIAEINNDNNV